MVSLRDQPHGHPAVLILITKPACISCRFKINGKPFSAMDRDLAYLPCGAADIATTRWMMAQAAISGAKSRGGTGMPEDDAANNASSRVRVPGPRDQAEKHMGLARPEIDIHSSHSHIAVRQRAGRFHPRRCDFSNPHSLRLRPALRDGRCRPGVANGMKRFFAFEHDFGTALADIAARAGH